MRDIDRIIEQLRKSRPEIQVQQLEVAHPGVDDDGIWFIRLPFGDTEIQLESPVGSCPFLVEGNDSPTRDVASSPSEAVSLVLRRLGVRA